MRDSKIQANDIFPDPWMTWYEPGMALPSSDPPPNGVGLTGTTIPDHRVREHTPKTLPDLKRHRRVTIGGCEAHVPPITITIWHNRSRLEHLPPHRLRPTSRPLKLRA